MADTDAVAQAHVAAVEVQQAKPSSNLSGLTASSSNTVTDGENRTAETGSLFGGWGLPDITVVAGSLGGIFGDTSSAKDDAQEERNERGDSDLKGPHARNNIGQVAAHIAADASKELEHASKAAQDTIGKAAEEIGRGWGTLNTFLDDMLTSNADKPKKENQEDDDDIGDDDDVQARYHALFPEIDAEDDVVDHYACALLQKYRCYLNNSTPELTLPMRGRLFVSTANIAMHVFDAGEHFGDSKFTIVVPFSDVARVQKGAKAMMRVITKSQTSFIFANFETDTHFNASLNLVEHMIESNPQAMREPPNIDERITESTGEVKDGDS
jgi:GRAM domain